MLLGFIAPKVLLFSQIQQNNPQKSKQDKCYYLKNGISNPTGTIMGSPLRARVPSAGTVLLDAKAKRRDQETRPNDAPPQPLPQPRVQDRLR